MAAKKPKLTKLSVEKDECCVPYSNIGISWDSLTFLNFNMIKWNSEIITTIMLGYLVGCSASHENCQRMADAKEEFNDDIHILLHTRPYDDPLDTHNSFHAPKTHDHRWAFVFLFPKSRKIVTHEGAVVDGIGKGCSYHSLPPTTEGSTLRLVGTISGSPKYLDDLSRETNKQLNYPMRLVWYSRNYVMVMARMIGTEIWNKIKDSELLLENVENLYSSEIVNEYDSIRSLSETYIKNKRTNHIKTMTWGDFKCLASLGLYAFEATLIPYMLKQDPVILLVYSFAIDCQATTTYEYINQTVDTLNLSDLMKIMVTVAKSLYFCLHWISGTVRTLLVLRFTLSIPKMIVLLVLCCE